MVEEEKLSSVLTDFAHTMATDFPIQAILDHLVERIVEVLPVTARVNGSATGRVTPRIVRLPFAT